MSGVREMSELQAKIIETLKVQPQIDPEKEIRRSIDFLKAYLKKNSFLKTLVLGISGGQDSTLAGKLSQMAITGNAGRNGRPRLSIYRGAASIR